jgi:hypothetical protein
MAAAGGVAQSALATLPQAVVLLVFAPLPVDERARCSCVCRGWRAGLSERSLWTRLDVSRTSGVAAARVTGAFLRGAAARAGGELQTLEVAPVHAVSSHSGSVDQTYEGLFALLAANVGALRTLHVRTSESDLAAALLLPLRDVEALLSAAPQLRVLHADVRCASVADARRALRADDAASEGLLTPLRLHGLRVDATGDEEDVLALAADVASHAWLRELCVRELYALQQPLAAVDAFLDASLACRLTTLQLMNCALSPASAPALARLLGGRHLTHLRVQDYVSVHTLLDAPAAALLAEVLRANTTLTALHLVGLRFWEVAAAAITLLGALVAHESLHALSVHGDSMRIADRAPAGAALGALLAADAPALTALDIGDCELRDAGMAPLLAALPGNTHLRTLACAGNEITEAFAADVLLLAVRANGSLRALGVDGPVNLPTVRPAEHEAAAFVREREEEAAARR